MTDTLQTWAENAKIVSMGVLNLHERRTGLSYGTYGELIEGRRRVERLTVFIESLYSAYGTVLGKCLFNSSSSAPRLDASRLVDHLSDPDVTSAFAGLCSFPLPRFSGEDFDHGDPRSEACECFFSELIDSLSGIAELCDVNDKGDLIYCGGRMDVVRWADGWGARRGDEESRPPSPPKNPGPENVVPFIREEDEERFLTFIKTTSVLGDWASINLEDRGRRLVAAIRRLAKPAKRHLWRWNGVDERVLGA